MDEQRVANINAAKREIFATFLAMNGPMAHSEMAQEKWQECKEAVAVEAKVTATLMMTLRTRLM